MRACRQQGEGDLSARAPALSVAYFCAISTTRFGLNGRTIVQDERQTTPQPRRACTVCAAREDGPSYSELRLDQKTVCVEECTFFIDRKGRHPQTVNTTSGPT